MLKIYLKNDKNTLSERGFCVSENKFSKRLSEEEINKQLKKQVESVNKIFFNYKKNIKKNSINANSKEV